MIHTQIRMSDLSPLNKSKSDAERRRPAAQPRPDSEQGMRGLAIGVGLSAAIWLVIGAAVAAFL